MDESRECREVRDARDMRFVSKDRLIEMSDAPSLGDIESECIGQLIGGFFRDRVSPCPERNEETAFGIECHISVHHGAYADGTDSGERLAEPGLIVVLEISVTVLKTVSDRVERVGPDLSAVFVDQFVLPCVGALCDDLAALVRHYRLDPGGTEFDSQSCVFHLRYPPLRIIIG